MTDKTEQARKIARELAARPENKSVDSAWYCIAVFHSPDNYDLKLTAGRHPPFALEISAQE